MERERKGGKRKRVGGEIVERERVEREEKGGKRNGEG